MDSKELRNLHEAYMDVYAPQELDEAEGSYGQTPKADAAYTALAFGKGKSKTKSLALKHAIRSAADRYKSDKPYSHRSKMTQSDRDYHRGQSENSGKDREGIDFDEFDTGASGPGGKPKGKKLERQKKRGISAESYDLYDIILSHLLDEGYADTEDAAESIMVNMSEEWREDILAEAITSEKGKAKAAEMIAARSTPSGRAKSGKGANVAQIRQIRGSGRGDFDREGLGGTPMTPTMAKNPIKKQNYTGTGNKAARRAGTYKESFNIFVNSMIAEGVSMERYTWEEIQNVFDDLFEAQVANRNPDEYERKAKQGQSREQQLKGKVMGRMSQMDPDKKAAMLKQMRAVGLDV
jgi:hypothetical protein